MGVRKLVTRIMNIGFLAGSAVAIAGIVTQPVLSVGVEIAIPGDMISDLVKKNLPGGDSAEGGETQNGDSGEQTKAYHPNTKRDGGASSSDFLAMLDKVNLAGVFDGLTLTPTIELPSLFEFLKIEKEEQPLLIKTVVNGAIDKTLDTSISTLVTGFNRLVPEVAKVAAKEMALGPAIKDQIAGVMKLESDNPEVAAKFAMVEEKVDALVDNVWNTLTVPKENGEPTTVDDVMDTVEESINEVFSTLAEAGVEGFSADQKFDEESLKDIKDGMSEMLQEVGLANEQGEIQDMNSALAMMLQMLSEGMGGNTDGGGTHNDEPHSIESQKIKLDVVRNVHLDMIDQVGYVVWDAVEFASSYIVTVNDEEKTVEDNKISGTDLLNVGDNTFSIVAVPGNTDRYENSYPYEFIINVDSTGAVTLVFNDQPKEQEKAIVSRVTRDGAQEQGQDQDIEKLVRDFVDPLIAKLPLDSVTNINLDEMIGIANMTMYAYLGLCLLASLPWLLFFIFTLVRTLRKRKCWAKPWFVFVFAFLELILGAGLYFGLKYGLTFALDKFGGMIPIPEEYAGLLAGISISFKMHCLWAGIVYLAMIPYTIVYMVFAHGAKKEYKIWKKAKALAKKISKGNMEFKDVKEKYQKETAKILAEKYDINVEAAK